jgi:hypothetical protein
VLGSEERKVRTTVGPSGPAFPVRVNVCPSDAVVRGAVVLGSESGGRR